MKPQSLESYFQTVYQCRLRPEALPTYRYSARLFDEFADGPIDHADETTVERFRQWLRASGYSPMSYNGPVKAMLRQRFPRGPWRQSVTFIDRERRGTLDHAFTTGFAKRRGRRVVDAETQRRYSRTFLLLSEHLGRPAELADLTARRAAEFLTWLANDRGMADWTVANHSQRIGALWRWAYQEKLVDGPPTWRLEGNRSDD
jgi:hypothetical protein